MNRRFPLYFYGITLVTDLVAIHHGYEIWRYISKPLLMAWLFLFAWFQPFTDKAIKKWLMAAVAFSWAGDVFLLMENQLPAGFILGLTGFLLAHVCYILLFLRLRSRLNQKIRWNWFAVFILLIYVSGLLYLLYPTLGDLKIPVLLYAAVLASMFYASLHVFTQRRQPPALWCIAGAGLFVISDSLLALNRFYSPFAYAGIAVMLTYAFAQLFIVAGISLGHSEG